MLKKLLPKSEFGKNVVTLMTGTSIAQALPLAVSPILTRIYAPEDFGLLAIYMSMAAVVSVIATGRYEMAIMLPKPNSHEVHSIVKLTLIIIITTAMITLFVVAVFNDQISNLFDNKEISHWLYFLPLSILITGLYQIYNYLIIREKKFKLLSNNKVIMSTSNISTQLAIGLSFHSAFGLILGNILGYIASIYFIIKSKAISPYFIFLNTNIKDVAGKYKKFPIYDAPAILVSVITSQLPLLALGKFFSMSILGFYSLMYKVLMVPITLLSNSVLDIFKQRATEDYNKYGNCQAIYISTFKRLVLLGAFPFFLLGLFSPSIFSFVFGDTWRVSGEFAQIMAPMFFLNFIVNPLSYTFFVVQKQNINLIGHVILFLLTVVSIYIGILMDSEYIVVLLCSVSYSIVYVVYIFLSYQYAKGNHI